MTTQGFSSVSTVMPPMSAWIGMPSNSTAAGSTRSRRRGRCASTATSVARAMAASTNVSSRLPNSMNPWMPYSGVLT